MNHISQPKSRLTTWMSRPVFHALAKNVNRFLAVRRSWIIAVVVVLYACNIGYHWRPFPDSATYLLLAKNLSDGSGYTINGLPHGKYPPGFPGYLTTMERMGLGDMLTLNVVMILLALATLLACYCLLRHLTTPNGALLATVVISILFEVYRLSGAQLSDIPFMLLVTAGVSLLLKGLSKDEISMELGSISLLASCWVRVLGIPLCLAVAVGVLLQGRRQNWRRACLNATALAMGAMAIALCLFARDRAVDAAVTVTNSYSAELSAVTQGNPAQWVWQLVENFFGSGVYLARFLTAQELPAFAALLIFWLPILLGAFFVLRKGHYIPLLAAAGYLGSILMLRVPLARYFLPIAPILVLCLGQGFRIATLQLTKGRWSPSGMVVAGALILIACNLPKDVRLAYRTHHPDRIVLEGREDLFRTAEYLRSAAPQDAQFATSRYPNMLCYLSGRVHMPFSFRAASPNALSLLEDTPVRYVILWPRNEDDGKWLPNGEDLAKHAEDWQVVFRTGDVTVLGRCPDSTTIGSTDSPPHVQHKNLDGSSSRTISHLQEIKLTPHNV